MDQSNVPQPEIDLADVQNTYIPKIKKIIIKRLAFIEEISAHKYPAKIVLLGIFLTNHHREF